MTDDPRLKNPVIGWMPGKGLSMNRFDPPISGFIVCKNEAAVIGGCLDSLDFCREIVIVDLRLPTHGTLDAIEAYRKRGFPIRLIEREWPGYAKQKQFALDQCSQPWCLSLDLDERLNPELKAALSTMSFDDATSSSYAVRRREYLPQMWLPAASGALQGSPSPRSQGYGAFRRDSPRP